MRQPNFCRLSVLDIKPYGDKGSDGVYRFFALRLCHPGWKAWTPGQFLMLRPMSFGLEIPWGRPLGICNVAAGHLECFFQVLGRGTSRMAELAPGDAVDVWGPLGKGFAVEPDAPTLLLAGGMGIVPFAGYAQKHPRPANVSMLFGHREPVHTYPVDDIVKYIELESRQEHASKDLDRFIASMRERMRAYAARGGLVLACGPLPFLQTVHKFAKETRARVQLSLENRMACGVGACLGCVTSSADGTPLCTCRDGPVFWADRILL